MIWITISYMKQFNTCAVIFCCNIWISIVENPNAQMLPGANCVYTPCITVWSKYIETMITMINSKKIICWTKLYPICVSRNYGWYTRITNGSSAQKETFLYTFVHPLSVVSFHVDPLSDPGILINNISPSLEDHSCHNNDP